jgi:3-methyladenine DNA glycosylase/8-oxoguanine DNA glycosylase
VRVRLDVPRGFSFRRTVLSHGWSLLSPFSLGKKADSLATTVALPGGGAARIVLRKGAGGVWLETRGRPGAAIRGHLMASARRILNLDLDLSPFHAVAASASGLEWIAETGAGRLLRAPTAFEDLVKLVLTTNCSWALTTRMTRALVEAWGEPAADRSRAFPRPEVLAACGERALREIGRTGYRAPHLASIARRVSEGGVDPESWERDGRDPAALKKEMLALPGVGPYVAENLLKMIGRPDGLALDSWMRGRYATLYHGGRAVSDRTISRKYRRMGRWAGLAIWLDLTRDWLDGDDPSEAWESLA